PTWRWFGPPDPITLPEIRQTGARGIVTALHHIPFGEVWSKDEIIKRKQLIEAEKLPWSVAESVPVHEDIHKKKGNYKQYLDNFKETLRNLGQCGIDTVCYNFMPVFDWLRTDLDVEYEDGSLTTQFEVKVLAAFDLFILQRTEAEKDYSNIQIQKAEQYYKTLNESQKDKLVQAVLLGFPGSCDAYTLKELKSALLEYNDIGSQELQDNLFYFLREIIPVAEENGVFMNIHPDDPPWSVLGLPRVVKNKEDIQQLLQVIVSPANGLTFGN
ncbi:MAG: mannonate dehydratase, partial [bacterium]